MRQLRYFKWWLALGWAAVLTIIFLSLIPKGIDVPIRYGDKWGHLLAYGVLMGWFVQLYQSRSLLTLHAVLFVVTGIGLEFLQGYTGRHFEYADMVANASGVLLGLLLLLTPWHSLLCRFEHRFLPAK